MHSRKDTSKNSLFAAYPLAIFANARLPPHTLAHDPLLDHPRDRTSIRSPWTNSPMPRRTAKRPLKEAFKIAAVWSSMFLVGVGVGSLGAGAKLKNTIYHKDQEIAKREAERTKIIASAQQFIGALSDELIVREIKLQAADKVIEQLQERVEFYRRGRMASN